MNNQPKLNKLTLAPSVIVDGRRLTDHATGVGRYLSLLLNAWSEKTASLAFQPVIVQHSSRTGGSEPWKTCFPSKMNAPQLPGWIWENLILASSEYRNNTLFAPANLIPYKWRGPTVLVIHDTFCEHSDAQISRLNRLRFRGRYRRSAQRADLILTPSQATADDIRRFFGVPDSKIKIVIPGISDVFHQSTLNQQPKNFLLPDYNYVLFVGKKATRRSFPEICKSIELLRKSGSDLKLVCVGPSGKKKMHYPDVIDLGYVTDDHLAELYRNATALVWPSMREGFGLPVAEAMASGCPVITTPRNAIAEVAGSAALQLPGVRAHEIATAIYQISTDSVLRKNLIDKGLEQANQFNKNHFADTVAKHITQFL